MLYAIYTELKLFILDPRIQLITLLCGIFTSFAVYCFEHYASYGSGALLITGMITSIVSVISLFALYLTIRIYIDERRRSR